LWSWKADAIKEYIENIGNKKGPWKGPYLHIEDKRERVKYLVAH